MASIPRKFIIEDFSYFHITWQCHNKDFILRSEFAKQLYYDLLVKFKDRYGVQIFSYCFMSNHIHLVGSCEEVTRLSGFMRVVNSRFAKEMNEKLRRRGQVVMDRFKSPTIHTDTDLLNVMRYLDLNPYRAKMVRHPKNYRWSSFAYYAYGKEDKLVTRSVAYQRMGKTDKERQKTYIDMIEELMVNDIARTKRNYSTTYFIGDPLWVEYKYQELKEKRKELKQERIKSPPNIQKLEANI